MTNRRDVTPPTPLTPLELVLGIDVVLIVTGGLRIATLRDSSFLATLANLGLGVLAAAAFWFWRSKRQGDTGRVTTSAPGRRLLGVLLLGIGGAMASLAATAIAAATWSALHAPTGGPAPRRYPEEREYELLLAVAVWSALLLGHAIMLAGAWVRSEPPKAKAPPLGGIPF